MTARALLRRLAPGITLALVSGIFGYAGATKWADPRALADAIDGYRLPLAAITNPVALLLPPLELIVAVALWLPAWRRAALGLAGALTALFLLALLQAAARGFTVDCGCFGTEPPSARGMAVALARAVALLAGILWLRRTPVTRTAPTEVQP